MAWGTLERTTACPESGINWAATPARSKDPVATTFAPTSADESAAPRKSTWLKSTGDLVLGSILLVLVSPLLLVLVLGIRLDSPGAGFFRQVRVGKDGRLFRVYKLRTMVSDAEDRKADLAELNEYDGVLFKMRNDPRITRFGALLRRTSLDELPQLINVVRGEMSLVGPRPSLPDEVALMDEATMRRFSVRPGMTGLWQVSGRSNLGWDEAKALDTYYAENWTIAGDLAILLRTAKVVVTAEGAC